MEERPHDQIAVEVLRKMRKTQLRMRKQIALLMEKVSKHDAVYQQYGGVRVRLAQIFWALITAVLIWLSINYLETKHETQNREIMKIIQQTGAANAATAKP